MGGLIMSSERKVEVFSAGCAPCEETVAMVRRLACSSCEIEVVDIHDPAIAAKAKSYGFRTVPAVAVDGQLVGRCSGTGSDDASLRAAGVGTPLP
jgi:glutaredoxin 3